MNVIKAIYNFLVGDMIILVGVLLVVAVLAIINNVDTFESLRSATGGILITAVLAVLVMTLTREARGKR